MELRHLRYFAAVAAHGSFSRAANNLHLTQPALSRQVKDLEDELGVPLFVRGTNAVTLTEAGEIFYEEARDLLARADQAIQRVRGEARHEILRVGYGPSLTAGIMPRALERFQSMVPRVRIELEDLSPREMSEKVAAGQLDLVIVPASAETMLKGFQWSELRRMAPVMVLAREHPLAKLAKIPPKRLNGLPLHGLGRANFPDYVPSLRAMLKPFGVVPDFRVLENDGVTTMFAGLEATHGASILADGVISMLPRSLVLRPFSPALPEVVILAGLPADRPNPHAETFAKLLREEALKIKTRTKSQV
jgi:LysR family transcriptional regulator, benzoate and cis,cis-muconate-responsive activator of ben and cat genes